MLAIVALCVAAAATPSFAETATRYNIQHISLAKPHAFQVPSSGKAPVLPSASFSVPISGSQKKREVKKQLIKALRSHKFSGKGAATPPSGSTAVLAGSDFDEEYLVNVTIGGTSFPLIVDTGSSDTWVATTNFSCTDLQSNPQPQDACRFGSLFDTASSSTFSEIPNVNFNITYGDGEFLHGGAANETVTVGDLTIERQEIGIVKDAAWNGDGINSGLVGLAYPGLTSVFEGTDPKKDNFPNASPYLPLPFTALRDGVMKYPYFSLALNRATPEQASNDPFTPNLGFLSFGGIAPVPVLANVSVTTAIQGYNVQTFTPSNETGSTDFFYTIDVQDMAFTGSKLKAGAGFTNNIILDSGTTLNILPTPISQAFAAAVNPPATLSDDGTYVVNCNATIPEFHVRIQGTTFVVDPKDNVLPTTDVNGNAICILGTIDGGDASDESTIFILGDTFLHNVVSTFNIQDNTVTLTQREAY